MLQIDLEQEMVNGDPLMELMGKPNEVLLQVKDALQKQDYALLVDLLQYEFSVVTDQWHAMVARLRQEAENLRTGSRL